MAAFFSIGLGIGRKDGKDDKVVERLRCKRNQATSDDLLVPITALLLHPKCLIVNEEFSGGIDSLMSVLRTLLSHNSVQDREFFKKYFFMN